MKKTNVNANQSNQFKVKRLTVSALMMALAAFIAIICALIPGLNFSFGGGITVGSMLPVVIISYMYGVRWGLFTGLAYSIFQMIIGGNTVMALFLPGSDTYSNLLNAVLICLIDYVIAYTCLGLGGVFRGIKKKNGEDNKTLALVLGVVLALSLRYVAHIVSGAIFYGSYAEWFFTETAVAELEISRAIMQKLSGTALAVVYSVVYNGCYMIPEIVITVLAALCVAKLPIIKKQTV